MAGTNTSITPETQLKAPVIILVRPQLGENIGMCARAMLNCAVSELRIVAPRDGWPNAAAVSASSGAVSVIENARIFDTTAEAVADLDFVLATTARNRGVVKDIYAPEAAARLIHEKNNAGGQCGIMFGPERTGLENDDIALANAILNIPLNPAFSSLNLAQAVLLVCHGWLSADNPFREADVVHAMGDTRPATRGEVENLMQNLEESLAQGGFFRSPEQRPTLMRNIRNFFFRIGATQQEVSTLHGIFACLSGRRTSRE